MCSLAVSQQSCPLPSVDRSMSTGNDQSRTSESILLTHFDPQIQIWRLSVLVSATAMSQLHWQGSSIAAINMDCHGCRDAASGFAILLPTKVDLTFFDFDSQSRLLAQLDLDRFPGQACIIDSPIRYCTGAQGGLSVPHACDAEGEILDSWLTGSIDCCMTFWALHSRILCRHNAREEDMNA